MFGIGIKLSGIAIVPLAGIAGFVYVSATTPITAENAPWRARPLCYIGIPLMRLKSSSSRGAQWTDCPCLIEGIDRHFGKERAAEIYDTLRRNAVATYYDNRHKPSYADVQLIERLTREKSIPQRCGIIT